jgi:hypothetical protein
MLLQTVSRSIEAFISTTQVRDAAVFVSLSVNTAAAIERLWCDRAFRRQASTLRKVGSAGVWADRFKGL